MFTPSRVLSIAHWYCGTKMRHRFMRDKRFHPNTLANHVARNKVSMRKHYKTNRWNYVQAYKDMP